MMEATSKDDRQAANSGDRVWTLDELRKSANRWSLASDMGMLQQLQELSQKMMRHTHDLQDKMSKLVQEAKLTDVRVNNAFNSFTMLANTQFVENRVYEEDIADISSSSEPKAPDRERTQEEREAQLLPKISEAMTLGLNVIDDAYIQLDVSGTGSDSDDDGGGGTSYRTDPILEAKDPYAGRPLPCMIGSAAFLNDDQVGLVDESSEEEEVSDQGSISESEEESESEVESRQVLKKDAQQSDEKKKSDSETSSQEGSDMFENAPPSDNEDEGDFDKPRIEDSLNKKVSRRDDFAADLAAKIGAAPPSSENGVVKEKVKAEEDAGLFTSHGPDDDDDSPFGAGGLFSGGGLFDEPTKGGLFDDVADVAPIQNSSAHKPASKTSGLFDEDEDLLGEPVKKADQLPPKAIVPEVVVPKTVAAASSNHTQPNKQPPRATGITKGLFDDDDEEEDDDLFAPVAPRNSTVSAKAQKQNNLFATGGDDGDIFAESSKVTSENLKSTPPPDTEAKPKKKLPAGARPMFGSAAINPLVAAIRRKKTESEDETASEEDTRSNQSSASTHSANRSLRQNDHSGSASSSSLFAEEPMVVPPAVIARTTTDKKETDKVATPGNTAARFKSRLPPSLFDDEEEEEDDLFGIAVPKPNDAKPRTKSQLMFDNDDEDGATSSDLFTPSNTSNATKTIHDDLSSNKVPATQVNTNQTLPATVTSKPTQRSLFDSEDDDDDDDDLFSAKKPVKNTAENSRPRASSKSLFDDERRLFASDAAQTPTIDLFAPAVSTPANVEDSTSTVEIGGATIDSSSSDVPVPSASSPRKLAGAVSMFGGIDPAAVLRKVKPSQSEESPLSGDVSTPRSSESPVRNVVPRIGDHQMNLAINPLSLLPGASMPPRQHVPAEADYEPREPVCDATQPVGFDEAAVQTNNLHNIAKDRVRIQTKRRPPSRKSRKATATTDQSDRSISPSDITVSAVTPRVETRLSDVFGDVFTPKPSNQANETSTPRADSGMPPSLASDDDDDDNDDSDLFGDVKTDGVSKTGNIVTVSAVRTTMSTAHDTLDNVNVSSEENGPPLIKSWLDKDMSIVTEPRKTDKNDNLSSITSNDTETHVSTVSITTKDEVVLTNEDIFATTSAVTDNLTSKVGYDDEDDIFSAVISKKASNKKDFVSTTKDDIFATNADDDDIFASASSKVAVSDDIFSSVTQEEKKIDNTLASITTDKEDIFAPNALKASTKNDDDDIFAVPSSSRHKQKAKTADEDIFADDTDIFADLPQQKVREKKTIRKHVAKSKSLFSDDVDDLFAVSTSRSKKTTTGGATGKTSARKTKAAASIFNDDDDTPSIFDDPLNALGKS